MDYLKINYKHVLLIIFLFSNGLLFTQTKFLDRNGEVVFEASEATFEPVKAKNNSVTTIINIQTGEFASLALLKEFHFKNALMQEHFNENYAESDVYPKAIFTGKIAAFNFFELNEKEKELTINGNLNFHGVRKELEIQLFISSKNDILYLRGSFNVKPQDFNIKIPKIVRNKIAKTVVVRFNFKLKAK